MTLACVKVPHRTRTLQVQPGKRRKRRWTAHGAAADVRFTNIANAPLARTALTRVSHISMISQRTVTGQRAGPRMSSPSKLQPGKRRASASAKRPDPQPTSTASGRAGSANTAAQSGGVSGTCSSALSGLTCWRVRTASVWPAAGTSGVSRRVAVPFGCGVTRPYSSCCCRI